MENNLMVMDNSTQMFQCEGARSGQGWGTVVCGV